MQPKEDAFTSSESTQMLQYLVANMKNQQKVLGRLEAKMENMATKQELTAVSKKVDTLTNRVDTLTEKVESLAQDLESLAAATHQEFQTVHAKIDDMGVEMNARMATKTDLRASEQRMMDHTDKRMHQAEEKILGAVRREDEKVDEHIRA